MAFFKAQQMKTNGKFYPVAVLVDRPMEINEIAAQIAEASTVAKADVVAVLASANGEKITFLAVCGPEAVKRGIKAGELVKSVCAVCGGKGGGKPDSAMGGGSDLLKLDDALATVDDFVAEKLK